MKFKTDFKVGYSPERINPGDKVHTFTTIKKVVSGCSQESLDVVAQVYESVVKAGIHKASSIKVAEAAKVVENAQRDINIAFVNELAKICNLLDIDSNEVVDAMNTKWNALGFRPGLVGGHCIGVDPYYLTHKAKQLGYHAQMINSGRFINDSMGGYVAKQIVKQLVKAGKHIQNSKILIMGITFKEDVSDIRNSKVVDVYRELLSYGVNVDVVDPYANAEEVKEEYQFDMIKEPDVDYDVVIAAVSHDKYLGLNEDYFKSITTKNALFVDIKGSYRSKIKELNYWSL